GGTTVIGVDPRMHEHIADEVARATSIVRYAPRSQFSRHTHGGGEEFLVLEGVFQDEHGDSPAGTYVRNPPATAHTPRSNAGCTIFVKLWQFDPADRTQLSIETGKLAYHGDPARPGVEVSELYRDQNEVVTLERWRPGAGILLQSSAGLELLVVDGDFSDGDE